MLTSYYIPKAPQSHQSSQNDAIKPPGKPEISVTDSVTGDVAGLNITRCYLV